ncbi:hypothetical protein RM555_09575 [Micromonospora sp. DSM 115977]|uniref:Uncharacterized protein n=1 Tax=Micromonospora reichwaldensis TaxID=3075516 RepID=A0ABU2WTJ9_9ACTN|nr:hypothetical protein [Micromonospora sp. DSM 115977]MDT0529240.1 hypothetical protein [Micromonospora sp. DSM 115977]
MPPEGSDFTAGLPRKRMGAGLLVTDSDRGVMFVYDGGRLTPAQAARIVLPPAELRSWSWCDRREADGRLVPLLARRVAEALAARDDGVTRYLEDGFRVS